MTAPPPLVWFVVPDGVDDPERVSGGNVFDQRVEAELQRLGWLVRLVRVEPSAPGDPFDTVPDDALVLLDGLVAIGAPAAMEAAAHEAVRKILEDRRM